MALNRRLFCAAASLPWAARAQSDYPARPVKVIVPIAAGQSTDILARLVGDQLARALGQPFVIDNKPGAGTRLGTDVAAKAPADGYTLVMATSGGFAVAPAIYAKLQYRPVEDFAPISNLGTVTQTLVTAAHAPWNNLQQFLAAARKSPMNYASAGAGSTSHLTTEAFLAQAGVSMVHVPFKGTAEAQPQVISGDIQVMFDALPAVLPQIKAGKLKVLGVGSAQRSPYLPGVPTIAEQGLPGFEAIGWIGLAAPARTPPAILDRLNAELRRIMASAEMRDKLHALSFNPAEGSREEFARFIAADIAKWNRVARTANIKPE
ncbi:Bug family tripartite tricarboxylate transporter substrate binding protein [Ramlibacter alkalitolerans]|uniref:Tripartite tricarboxylate transporter substrate binding protein n=1 Tax=Ramlibacter alkalitolerans TaxID=2039631 RepID=A0ABS1JM26_9BURK|nr:tripartite tricarboxylate transporter substrate binding protein [Ramlibacter alkalitolerans]MBL0425181.1 tripartite tricarboxylate transporter substrate binding protein [Ramlibacter alkalitolerans]